MLSSFSFMLTLEQLSLSVPEGEGELASAKAICSAQLCVIGANVMICPVRWPGAMPAMLPAGSEVLH
jgi:hypothetical protein